MYEGKPVKTIETLLDITNWQLLFINESQPNLADLFRITDALKLDVRDLLAPNKFANGWII